MPPPTSFIESEGNSEADQEASGGSRKVMKRHRYNNTKWCAVEPVPWPNLFWLVCPNLVTRIGRLESRGYVKKFAAALQDDPESLALLATQQR